VTVRASCGCDVLARKATLTYKKRIPTTSAIKQQREEETGVADPEAMEAILEALGLHTRARL
jgi:adenylate cyclase class IV